jgi:hypothetical protein
VNENRKIYLLLTLLTVSLLIGCSFLIDNTLGHWGGDSAKYVLIARRLATGEGKDFIQVLGGKALYFSHIIVPLLLVPVIKLWGLNYFYMRWMFAGIAILSLWLGYFLLAREDKESALKSILLFGFSPLFLYYARYILTEIPYLFFSILCLLLAEQFIDEKEILTPKEIIFFCCSIVLFLTRYIGVSVIIAVFMYLMFSKKHVRKALFFLMFYLCILYIWIRLASTIGEYREMFKGLFLKNPYDLSQGTVGFFDLIFRWGRNFKYYISNLSYPVLPYLRRVNFLRIIFSFLIIAGLALKIRNKGPDLKEYYLLSYVFILPFWWWKNERFIFPVGFLFCFYIFWLGKHLLNKKKILNLVFILLVFINIYDCMGLISWENRVDIFTNSPQAGFFQMLIWIKQHISGQNVLIVSPKPANVCLLTGKLSTEPPYISAPWVVFNFLHSRGANFVIVDRNFPPVYKILSYTVNFYNKYFKLVKRIGDCYLFRFTYEE